MSDSGTLISSTLASGSMSSSSSSSPSSVASTSKKGNHREPSSTTFPHEQQKNKIWLLLLPSLGALILVPFLYYYNSQQEPDALPFPNKYYSIPKFLSSLIRDHVFSSQIMLYLMESYHENKALIYSSLLIGLASTITSLLNFLYEELYSLIIQKFTMQISLNNTEDVYHWFLAFLASKEASEIMVTSPNYKLLKKEDDEDNDMYDSGNEEADSARDFQFIPAPGRHVLKWKGYYIYLNISCVGESITTGWKNDSFQLETADMYTIGGKNAQRALFHLVHESINFQLKKYREKVKIYVLGRWSGWEVAMAKEKRPLDSVILPRGLMDSISMDIRKFLSRQQWYKDHGVPFRRGYLFYGVHGAGKTSLIQALAASINYDICVLNLSSGNLDDRELNDRLHAAPQRSIILLEDIDAIFADRDTPQEKENRGRQVSFSGFLNALDGAAAATDGRLFFMTTNHIEKLDSALLRAGRCDVKVAFHRATKDQIERCFKRFFPHSSTLQQKQFTEQFPENSVTMAQIQSHLLEHKHSATQAIQEAKSFFERISAANSSKSSSGDSNVLPLDQWLKRLALYHHYKKFKSKKFFSPLDFKDFRQNNLRAMGMKSLGERKRFLELLQGKARATSEFCLATRAQIMRFYRDLFGPSQVSEEEASELASLIPEKSVSLTQVRVYLSKKKYNGSKSATHREVLDGIDELLNPYCDEMRSDAAATDDVDASALVQKMLKEGVLRSVDLNCEKKSQEDEDNSEHEKESSESIYAVFEREMIVKGKHIAALREGDLKSMGICKKGSLIRWKQVIEKLKKKS